MKLQTGKCTIPAALCRGCAVHPHAHARVQRTHTWIHTSLKESSIFAAAVSNTGGKQGTDTHVYTGCKHARVGARVSPFPVSTFVLVRAIPTASITRAIVNDGSIFSLSYMLHATRLALHCCSSFPTIAGVVHCPVPGKVPYAETYNIEGGSRQTPASEYIATYMLGSTREEQPEYIFDAQVLFQNARLRDDAPIPDLFDFPLILQQFMLGKAVLGADVPGRLLPALPFSSSF